MSLEDVAEGAPVTTIHRGERVPLWCHADGCAYLRHVVRRLPWAGCNCTALPDLAEDDPARPLPPPPARPALRLITNEDVTE